MAENLLLSRRGSITVRSITIKLQLATLLWGNYNTITITILQIRINFNYNYIILLQLQLPNYLDISEYFP